MRLLLESPYVHLTAAEMKYAAGIGLRRYNDVARHRRTNRAKLVGTDDEIANHILGACGEAAFAKWVGVPYVGTVNTFHNGQDVLRYQIRLRRGDSARLIVREVDRDEDIFVLVTFNADRDRYAMQGWKVGYEAKQFQWRDDPRARGAAYFVPQSDLEPMLTLPWEADLPETQWSRLSYLQQREREEEISKCPEVT